MSEPSDLRELRRELRFARSYASPELTERIADWIEASYQRNDADTAREYVEHQLNQLLRKYPMYNAPDVKNATDAFPDRCQGCEHYGAACPVLKDGIQTRWRDRKLTEAETEKDARRVYEKQARDVNCVLIPELLEQWDTDISAFMRTGEQLLREYEREQTLEQGEDAPDVEEIREAAEDAGLDLDLDLDEDHVDEEAAATGGGSS